MQLGFREMIFLLVLLAVPAASYFYLFQPHDEKIRQARTEIEMKQAKLDRLHVYTAKIDDLGLEIEKEREAVAKIEAKLPSLQDVEGILEQIWQLAAGNQQTIKSVKSDKPIPAAMHMEQPLKVTMEGEFDGFYQFLLELENLPRITRVHQMKLQKLGTTASATQGKDKDASPPGSVKAEFTLSIYFQPETMPSATQ
jgi:type IV pilus assembly protein PilO